MEREREKKQLLTFVEKENTASTCCLDRKAANIRPTDVFTFRETPAFFPDSFTDNTLLAWLHFHSCGNVTRSYLSVSLEGRKKE